MKMLLKFILFIILCNKALPETISVGGIFEKGEEDIFENAFTYAIRKFTQAYFEPNVTTSSTYRLVSKQEIIQSRNSYEATKKICQMIENGINVIIGPKSPFMSPFVNSVLESIHIPHIQTGIDTFAGKLDYSINIHPHWKTLSRIVTELIRHKGWKKFTFLYEQNDAPLRMRNVLETGSTEGWKIEFRDLHAGYRNVLKELKRSAVSNILLDCTLECLVGFFKQAQQLGILTDYRNLIIMNLDFHTLPMTEFQYGQTNITGFRIVREDSPVLKEYVAHMTKHYSRIDMIKTDKKYLIKTDAALMFDSVLLYAAAVNNLRKSTKINTSMLSTCKNEIPWEDGRRLMDEIKKTKVQGLTGEINVEKGFRKNFEVEIIDLTRNGVMKTGIWSPKTGVKITRPLDSSLQDIYESLRLKTFKVTTVLNEPYTMLKKTWEMHSGNDRYEGYCVDLLNEIASKLKFHYIIHVVPDHQQGTRNTETGEWTGMIGELVNGTADVAIGDLTITHDRAQAVDFTMPFMNLGISILFKQPDKTTPSLFSFLSPLALDVWIYMLAAYIGVSAFLFILSRFSPYEWINPHPCNPDSELRENQFSLPNSLWFTGGSLMQQGTELMPKAWSTRMLAGTWWFFTLIMISSYTANLAAFLTAQRMNSPIESAEDLARQTKIKYGCYAGGSTEMFFRKSKLATFQRMWAFMESATPSVFTKTGQEGVQRVLNGNYAYLMEVTSIEYITERNCDLTQIGTLLDSKGYGIATPQGSPYRQLLSSAILQLQEETRLDSLKLKWWKEERGGGSCKTTTEKKKSSKAAELSLSNVGGVFVVLLGGLAVSCIIAMTEFIWETRKINENDRYSLCTEMFEELKAIVNCMGSIKPSKREPRIKKKKESPAKLKVPHQPPDRIPKTGR